ncbi:serine-protein kinase ATM [Venturia canescens]|uniref:serine-protein kinase ATM n=1 Tax=Venturia canescens TaxID=32260 RepID=UPI001C9C8DD9|nr:serine-protein kinase ATM [Venturia canescens]
MSKRCLNRIAEILGLADSRRVVDRKTFIKDLQDVYLNDEYIEAINEETSRDSTSSTSWNQIMLTIHHVVLMEVDKSVNKAAKGNSATIVQSGCCDLIKRTVSLAIAAPNMVLSCSDLMAIIFQIFGKKTYESYYDTYFGILGNVLANKNYRLAISPEQWREILNLCWKMYDPSPNNVKSVILEIARTTVHYGCLQSHLLLDVKNILPFLGSIYQSIGSGKMVLMKPVYRLTYAVCQQTATESRITLCEFSEKILPSIINLEGCSEKYNTMLLMMHIHHPGGADTPENGAYARDWGQWKNIVRGIYASLERDKKTEIMSPCFLKLACEVYRQVLLDPSYVAEGIAISSESQEMQPRKRRRLSQPVRKPVDMLIDNDLETTWPSIQILTVLLKKYPNTLNSDDYVTFIKTVTEFVIASLNNEMIMDSLCELCTILVNAEKEHFHQTEHPEVKICWEKIWDTILRALSMNQNEKLGHTLLQSIIENRSALNVTGFLRLYLTNAIRWSASSVKTLLIFCEYTPIPEELVGSGGTSSAKLEGSTRVALLKWSLEIPPSTQMSQVPVVELANLLTALVVRSWYDHEFRDYRLFQDFEYQQKIQSHITMKNDLFDDREGKSLNDIDNSNLSLNFLQKDWDQGEETPKNNVTNLRILHVRESLDFLTESLTNYVSDHLTVEDLEKEITKLTVIGKFVSNSIELNIRSERQVLKLLNMFERRFKSICSLLDKDTEESSNFVHVIEALEILYTIRYNREVSKVLIKSASMEYLQFLYELLLEDDEDNEDHDVENSTSFTSIHGRHSRKLLEHCLSRELSETCRLSNSSSRILAYYCCTAIEDKMTDAQKRVLKNLLKIDLYESNADVRRALNTLKTCGMFEKLIETSEESLEIANNFIRQLFESRIKDETVVRGILHVIPHFFKATRATSEKSKLLEILLTINKRLKKERYGPLVHSDFIKCIGEIIRLNPSSTWISSESVRSSPIMEILVNYINNPFYIVRLEVVRALHVVFAAKTLQTPSKVNFFKKIEYSIPELFTAERTLDDCKRMDELETRTITAVQIYAMILRANKFLSNQALFSMMVLSIQRAVKIETLKKALIYVTKSEANQRLLIETNLHYLLSQWFEVDHSLQSFPWTLVQCDSQEDFSRRYIGTLLSVKLQRLEFKHLAILCANLDVSFVKTVEDCFPTILTQLVSMIVEDSSEGDNSERVTYARQMFERLRSNTNDFREVKPFDVLLQEKLSEVVIHLVERLRDDEHFNEIFSRRIFLPSINPPNFTVGTIDRCFMFLEKILPVKKESLVEYFATRHPRILQLTVDKLFCNINEADCPDRKLQAFHQYRYFGTIVLKHLQKPYFDPMALFIVRDTSYSLLSLTKQETLGEMACDYLSEFLRGAMPKRANEIKEILSYIVSTLVPIAQSSTVKGAMEIVNFLIIEEQDSLGDAIEKLDSFPNVDSFEAIKKVHHSLKYGTKRHYTLEDEIEHFLNATNVKTLSCSYEGLVHVKNQLSTRKQELCEMYNRLEGLRGFAEDCASSTLHKLIYKLVQLTRSCDTNISLEAAKCLGQLGPADLTTMILHPENVYAKENSLEVEMLTFHVVNRLIDYLVDSNTNLRRASSSALYNIFSTAWGRDMTNKSSLSAVLASCQIENPNIRHYIYPFVNQNDTPKSRVINFDDDKWKMCINRENDVWAPTNYESYDKWIIDITCMLLDCFVNFYTPSLQPVCRESVEFCEILFPRLVNLVQSIDSRRVNDVCLCINRFFSRVYQALRETEINMTIPESPVTRDIFLSYRCVGCMINVVNFMRIQSSDNAPMFLEYLYIAKAAQYCSAYFTSVLYAELWCQSLLQDSRLLQDKIPGSWISPIDCICELRPEPGKLLQSIVREAYLHIGDPDSIYGCGLSHLIDPSYRIQHYVHLRQWDKVLLAQDVELSSGNVSARGVLHSLQQSGLQSLLGRVISTINKEQENVDDFMYEAAWRLADWNILESHRSHENVDHSTSSISPRSRICEYHSSHYRALKSLRESDSVGLRTFLDDARTSLVYSLRKISLECSQTVYPILSQLRMLQEIEDFANVEPDRCHEAVENWNRENDLDSNDFQWIEPILSQRLVMYQTKGTLTNGALINTHFDIAEIAEEQGYLSIAARALDSLSRHNLSSATRDELTYHEAHLAWIRKDQDIGRYLLRNLIKKSNLSPNLRAKALHVYGNWMAVTKSENPQEVIEKYYEESIKTSLSIDNQSLRDRKNLTNAQADVAQFADAQYHQIIEFMQSPQYESLLECTKLKDNESKSMIAGKSRDEQRAITIYQRQVTNDAAEVENIKREKSMYLVLAAKYYLMTLQTGEDHDLLVFRLVSLWLDNMFNESFNEILTEQIQNVASYKFIVLLPQLAPHMSNDKSIFTTQINALMERCAKEHPHHTLPVVLALKNTHKDNEFKAIEKGNQRRVEKIHPEPRVLAAEALIAKLTNSSIRPIIREMSDLSNALVALAYFNVSEAQARKKDVSHPIPRNQPIMKIRDYTNICVPTLTIAVKPRGDYNVVGIQEYVGNFDLPGGVNAPKKVVCIGSDGLKRKELVKGQDDLRQDAVMQQVCTVMNNMLRTSKETKKRKLHIRTYKIVPLSQRSGVLEWCENTLPISNVLCDSGNNPGMHTKYYPDDWSVSKCRSKLQAVDREPTNVKLKTFLDICKNLHPAFHHFFMEKYPSAETWFERRLAYVRSVATTSMVGYMLGLGDRHFSNILIDQTTAEVIHIDFGIAFAQGKVLPIPETVPFRLTRDMEVAMGICGVEGVMRRSCEETVAVLRDRRKILITLLQVLLYDPLFSWAITPVKTGEMETHCIRRYSGRVTEDREVKKTNKLAERALLRIEQKLQGTEDGISSSISGQVERLIQQARDPRNLCRLYSGWQAYL